MNCKSTFEIYFSVCQDENLENNLKGENNKYVINVEMFTVDEREEDVANLSFVYFCKSNCLGKDSTEEWNEIMMENFFN